MKEIRKDEFDLLIKKGILNVTSHGITDKQGSTVSYSRTKHKRSIEDKYIEIAQMIMRGNTYGKKEAQT